jgi:acyl-CoA thioesterase
MITGNGPAQLGDDTPAAVEEHDMIGCTSANVLEELPILLKLEKIEENIFRGQSQDIGFGSVFGGQVLGQALSAAYQTVESGPRAHSLPAYFLRLGDAAEPIVYQVDCRGLHRDFRMDDWRLYVMASPNANRARGLSNGRIYTRDGRLVASIAREGPIRYHGIK